MVFTTDTKVYKGKSFHTNIITGLYGLIRTHKNVYGVIYYRNYTVNEMY